MTGVQRCLESRVQRSPDSKQIPQIVDFIKIHLSAPEVKIHHSPPGQHLRPPPAGQPGSAVIL